ncbi:MAG TPA: TIGR04283 family arsenosugar biosynthesis glycosyltransferase, partial [Gammaproteobacteria bacterium]|nr:TIGR04283 family arsenosugar biosynthesis glycosyltransferase [Gammaproteobacteria bacterium]
MAPPEPTADGDENTLRLAIIMPALNEAPGITAALEALQPWRRAGHEVIVVDGGSGDDTVARALPLADQVLQCPRRGRAYQMNMGAGACRADVLIFLHADARLPAAAARAVPAALASRARGWGYFAVRLTGRAFMLRIVEDMMNWRSRLTGIATGDQALFVRKPLFDALGGYPAIPLMEDIAL